MDQAQQPGESAAEFAARLNVLLQEALRQVEEGQRQNEELQRQKEEAQRQKEEAQRALLLADLKTKRAIESERQKVSFIQMLQEDLQRQRDQTNAQALPAYLAQVSRLQTHAIRLLPLPHRQQQQQQQPQQPQGRGSIPPHVQRSSASGSRAASQSTTSKPTTSGRTDIKKKYYPLRLRPWIEFPAEVQQNAFARIYGALTQQPPAQHGLPSRWSVQKDEEALLEDLPLLALNLEGGLNAARTQGFLKAVLLTPASRILNEYLKSLQSGDAGPAMEKKIFFDTAVQSVETVTHSTWSAGSSHNPDNVTGDAGDVDNPQSQISTQSASNDRPRKVLPDCLVLCMDSQPTAQTPVQLVASAEQKPLHALRAASVSHIMDNSLPEDLLVRLARETQARRDRAAAQQPQTGRGQASESEPGRAGRAATKTRKIDKLTYFAYALAQTYHYMLLSGVEFGFLVTGEVIVFLRIPEDDATTLQYHTSLFPISGRASGDDDDDSTQPQAELPQDVTHAPHPAPGDPVSEQDLSQLPIALMASFCEHARHAERRSSAWAVDQIFKLARFPDLPPGVGEQYDQMPSSRLGRRGRGDDNNDDRDDNSRNDNGGRGHSHRSAHVPPGDEAKDQDISTTFLSTMYNMQTRPRPSYKVEPPTLPYCTHACLLGLVQSGPLDPQCPNVDLHRAARKRQEEQEEQEEEEEQENADDRHPVSSFELARRIRDQLYDTPEVDCTYSRSSRGAIGYPFTLTLTGFGYTFVGKAVREEHRGRLVRESRIYKGLLPLQGSVIPVHLGLIQLHVGYPILSDFMQLPYMMLLSYAGESMVQSLMEEEDEQDEQDKLKDEAVVRDRAEAARTDQELGSWGLDDRDGNVSNFRWCAETGRAMRIDFDRACLVVPLRRNDHRLSTNAHASFTSQTSQQSASSHSTPITPTRVPEESESLGLPLPLAGNQEASQKASGGPLLKRRKLEENRYDV